MTTKPADDKKTKEIMDSVNPPFITLAQGPVFIISWSGAPRYSDIKHGDITLHEFLESVRLQLNALMAELNHLFQNIDRQNMDNPENRRIFVRFLSVGRWAYDTALSLRPHQELFKRCLTSWLYVDWIYRLEEVYTKTFAITHTFGNEEERGWAQQALFWDFIFTGAINDDGSRDENGMTLTMIALFMAYLASTNRHPLSYQRYGETISGLAEIVARRYPLVAEGFAWSIERSLIDENHGFGSKLIMSPAKAAMMEKLTQAVVMLKAIKVPAAKSA